MAQFSPESLARQTLLEFLQTQQREESVSVEEFWIPQTHERADLALIGGGFQGFEIKSDRDTLRRLPRQIGAYGRVFDRCHLVAAEKHIEGALEILPAWWGVAVLPDKRGSGLSILRAARPNPDVDPETIVRLLWRAEAAAVLDHLEIGYAHRSPRAELWRAILEVVPTRTLSSIVRDAIAARPFDTSRRSGSRSFDLAMTTG